MFFQQSIFALKFIILHAYIFYRILIDQFIYGSYDDRNDELKRNRFCYFQLYNLFMSNLILCIIVLQFFEWWMIGSVHCLTYNSFLYLHNNDSIGCLKNKPWFVWLNYQNYKNEKYADVLCKALLDAEKKGIVINDRLYMKVHAMRRCMEWVFYLTFQIIS